MSLRLGRVECLSLRALASKESSEDFFILHQDWGGSFVLYGVRFERTLLWYTEVQGTLFW